MISNSINSIWADSECTVDSEYTSDTSAKSLNLTYQFKNSIINNKRGISKARKIQRKLRGPKLSIPKSSSKNDKTKVATPKIEMSNSFDNSAFKVGIECQM